MLRLSSVKGIGGEIKKSPEDFVVEEITKNGVTLERGKIYKSTDLELSEDLEGKFCLFIMQKTNWNTIQALTNIAKLFRRGKKSIGFAGTKDRLSVSLQLCSIFGVKSAELERIRVKDISINGAWNGSEEVKVGDLLGNRFKILVRDCETLDNLDRIIQNLQGIFPNYFGEQRFGYRDNNSEIGLDIMKGEFKSAAMRFLTDTSHETNEEAINARNRLKDEQDFRSATSYFPGYLKYERTVIEYLSRFPDNYANAMRKLPRQIALMFVHSVEDRIFNMELEKRVAEKRQFPEEGDLVCGKNFYGFPEIEKVWKYQSLENKDSFLIGNIIGYETQIITEEEKSIMGDMEIEKDSFKIKSMPELSCKGSFRSLFAPYSNISHNINQEDKTVGIDFSLPAGSYATVLMSELI